jgi:hypothetical protein
LPNLLWVLVAILIIAWLLGMGGVLPITATLAWILLIGAIVAAAAAFYTGSLYTR